MVDPTQIHPVTVRVRSDRSDFAFNDQRQQGQQKRQQKRQQQQQPK